MSQANSLARKRRAGITQNPFPTDPVQNQTKPTGLTLPQVVAVIDSRLIVLESFMKDTKSKSVDTTKSTSAEPAETDFMTEVNHRFEFLMNELIDLKDIVLKLQTYTMDVNKTLLDERIHLLSDISSPIQESFEVKPLEKPEVKLES